MTGAVPNPGRACPATGGAWHSVAMRRLGVWGAAVLLATGCTVPTEPDPGPAPTETEAEPTPLASYDAEGVRVVRGPFCDRISPTGIEHALGDVPETSASWSNGDREPLPDGSRDRVHEFGCRWSGTDGAEAAAWVFVPPVGRSRARELVASAVGEGCERIEEAPDFGSPGVATRCTRDDGDPEVQLAGRFGDAWLACSLVPVAETSGVPERVGAWCVQVLEAARG